MHITLFCTFFSHSCTTVTWNFLNHMPASQSRWKQHKKFCFLSLNSDTVLSDSTPENFANIWPIKWNWIRLMKFETVRIYFLCEFSVCCHTKILLPWQCEITTSPLLLFKADCKQSLLMVAQVSKLREHVRLQAISPHFKLQLVILDCSQYFELKT